jgi:hypothetical protein
MQLFFPPFCCLKPGAEYCIQIGLITMDTTHTTNYNYNCIVVDRFPTYYCTTYR